RKSSPETIHAHASNACAIDARGRIGGVPTDLTQQWRDLLARHARTTVALDEALDTHGLGVSEFEVLERLACECGERPRLQDLAPLLHLSQSALSRTVGRLEKDGLVRR